MRCHCTLLRRYYLTRTRCPPSTTQASAGFSKMPGRSILPMDLASWGKRCKLLRGAAPSPECKGTPATRAVATSYAPDSRLEPAFAHCCSPTLRAAGDSVLALPKLNLQFLTFHDYLMRNFNLFR